MRSVYLIRHAEPQLRGVFLGQLDPPLSAAGHEGARITLSQLSASIIYCSPLRRACETAQYIRAPETKTLEALREIHYGQWTGLSWSEIERTNPERASLKMTNWTGVTPPFGEAWSDFLLRLRPVCDEIRNGPQPAAVVAHQTVNAALAFLLADRNSLEFRQDYGEVIRVCFT